MHQEFNDVQNIQINRDPNGNARDLFHSDEPVVSSAPTAQLAAAEYLNKFGVLFGVTSDQTNNLGLAPESNVVDQAGELRFRSEKRQFDMTSVTFRQTHFGLPVWHGAVSIHMKHNPFHVVSAQSTRHADLDVYIEDGRHGEYQFQANYWSSQAIWNRRHSDGGTTHEAPVLGAKNFAYVRIKNRGTKLAKSVQVKAFHATPAAGLVFPNDWQPMLTPQLAAADVPPNSTGEITLGPFEWMPTQAGHECLLMIVTAAGDPSSIGNLSPGEAIPDWRLIPHDNNIGQRNMFPIAGGSGAQGLVAALDGIKIQVKNPHNINARVIVQALLPDFLSKGKWQVTFANPGAGGTCDDTRSVQETESCPSALAWG